jgi:hypothetical protein
VVLLSSKQFMTAHEVTWDKRSEIGGRSLVVIWGRVDGTEIKEALLSPQAEGCFGA